MTDEMERMRKEYLVLKNDQAGEADIVGVFSSRKKARNAVEKDSVRTDRNRSYDKTARKPLALAGG